MPSSTAHTASPGDLIAECRRQAEALFTARFGGRPQWIVAAPGRVNIIGEHTDYNDGFVLPMAIERYVVIAAAPAKASHTSQGPTARVFSANTNEECRVQLSGSIAPAAAAGWSSYVQGVVAGFLELALSVEPFDAVIHSTVPLGGGLSSSAALEVATATLLEAMSGRALEPLAKALLCQQAEHRYAGVPCGIMDQFSSVLCRADHLMLLDCRSQEVRMVPLADRRIAVVIANSNVRRELAAGEYGKQRRAQCEQAARALSVPSLRDGTLAQLAAAADRLDPVLLRRASHVISENDRTVRAADAIAAGDWTLVGELMYASHASLRDDYEVSCPELDLLMELARQQPGVIGSRMTGGGFGGCTVSLVRNDNVPAVLQALRENYPIETRLEPTIFVTRPAPGAQALSAVTASRGATPETAPGAGT